MEELIAVGRIVKPVGVHGACKVLPFAEDGARFDKMKRVFVGKTVHNVTPHDVETTGIASDEVVLKLSGIQTPEAVEELRDSYLFVQMSERVRLRKGSFFVDDLIGSSVISDDGREIGVLQEVWSRPPNDIWVVWTGTKEVLIPAVKEFVRDVDIENKKIVIHVMEGLVE